MQSEPFVIHHGDCREVMRGMPDNSVDSIVTDPPYGLSFMGKGWDHGVPGDEFWIDALRVAKPGAHLLAFGGTRTFHRLAVAIEDAGWEIRDTVMWVYGSGFPKSHDVSKAIDKAAGAERKVIGSYAGATNIGRKADNKMGYSPGIEYPEVDTTVQVTEPATDAAKQWEGWGTALKPAWEPVILARKPLVGTVAANVLEYGTGGINIDASRVGTTVETWPATRSYGTGTDISFTNLSNKVVRSQKTGLIPPGRWPANVIHDGSDEVTELFPKSKAGTQTKPKGKGGIWRGGDGVPAGPQYGDDGSAARFFYCAKANRQDREDGLQDFTPKARPTMGSGIGGQPDQQRPNNRNTHPTVKPTDLMRYLCRLVTPPGGIVLDPFMGSGSTGKAAILEGFKFVGIDITEEYIDIARARLSKAVTDV